MSAYVVHRWGPASVSLSENDRHAFARYPNTNYSAFAELVSNTANNICVGVLKASVAAKREIEPCAKQALLTECGGEDVKTPAAKAIGLRSWAVAYGRSGFELNLTAGAFNGVQDFDAKAASHLWIHGPLVTSAQRPVWQQPLIVANAAGVDHVYLMNNDGAGNLNFQIDFKDKPDAHMRLSLSSLLATTAYQQEVEQSVLQMPAFPASDAAPAQDQDLK